MKKKQTTASGISRKKVQVDSSVIFFPFCHSLHGGNKAGDFPTHAFITVYNGDFEREKILCVYKIISKHQNTHALSLFRKHFVRQTVVLCF